MPFTYEEIVALQNPYEHFSNGDALAENAKVLNELSEEEQIEIASLIIEACPEPKFKQYRRHIDALNHFKEGSFHSVLSNAHQVRGQIVALLDPKNENPQGLFLEEFNPTAFHNFSDLAAEILRGKERAIAERFALCTPAKSCSKLARNIEICFPQSSFATKTQTAFTIRHNIDKLLGKNPEQFFESRDFNKDAYNMFPSMFQTLLHEKEEQIGKKLSALDSESQSNIRRQLELLHTEVFDEANPFKLIAEAMGPIAENKATQSTNPSRMFTHSRKPSISPKFETPKVSAADDKRSEEEYDVSSFSC